MKSAAPSQDEAVARLRAELVGLHRELVSSGLVVWTAGNVSARLPSGDLFLIKPSGVDYADLTPESMILCDLDGTVVEGTLKPSSDTAAHAYVYRNMPQVGGVVHTHSSHASGWAQARRAIPCLGTTHADHFDGPVPVTRGMTRAEIDGAYEHETGVVIVETLDALGLDPLHMPGALVASHGPFTWGPDAATAVANAVALEAVAAMAEQTLALRPDIAAIDAALLRRHFDRKHGVGAYYGQPRPSVETGR